MMIMHMPEQYDTKVGKEGLSFRRAEAACGSIARAIESPIIILDEATASVDVEQNAKSRKPSTASQANAPL